MLEVVERPGLRRREQRARRIEGPHSQACLGGGERSVGSARRIAGERHRTLQKRRRGSQAAARLRPAR